MKSNIKSNKVFVVENEEGNYNDICACLPTHLKPEEFMPKYDPAVVDRFNSSYYCLCICDLLEVETKDSGLPLDHPRVIEGLKAGIKRLANLRDHFDCPFVVVTKFPVRKLRDNLDKLKDDPDINLETIFSNNYSTLRRKLNAKKHHLFGTIYECEKIYIVIKPYYALEKPEQSGKNIEVWKEEFTELLSKICS